MESRQLFVFGLLLARVSLGDAFLRGVRPPGYWGPVMQPPEAVQAADPMKQPFSLFSGPSNAFHSKWIQPTDDQPQWKFPQDPVDSVGRHPVQFKVQEPVPSKRVAVRCGESKIQVEVKQDFLGIGKLINPDELTLGGCPAAAIDPFSHVLIFESELHDCGSTLEVSQDGLIYSFKLIYNPKNPGTSPIIRSQRTVTDVECRYMN